MEKLNLQLNPKQILKASDMSAIISAINRIIDYIESGGSGNSGSSGNIVEIPKPILSYASYQSTQTPLTPDGYNEKGMPWGIWLYSYLESDSSFTNPISERLLDSSEYTQYLGSGYNITTNVAITCRSNEFRDELFNEPMQVSLYPSGSTNFSGATLARDNYKITGVPRMWETLIDLTDIDPNNTYGVQAYYTDYRQFIEPSQVIYNLNWHNTFYNKAVSMWESDDSNPIVGFTGTVTMTTGSNNTTTVTEPVQVPINPARDLSLDHLFVIIPNDYSDGNGHTCTWGDDSNEYDFTKQPEYWMQIIKANDKNSTIATAQTQYENDIKKVLKDTIIRNGTDRFGLDFGTEANPTTLRSSIANYLNAWQSLCNRFGIDMRNRAKDIVIGWYKKYDPSHVHEILEIDGVERDYGIEQDPGIIWSDFDGIWDSSLQTPRYTGANGYRYVSVKHMRDIPRFDKLYCLDDIASGYSSGGPTIYKGPIQDMNNCPRFENNVSSTQNVIDGSWWANTGDIVVELISTTRENHHQIEYDVMYGDTGQMRTDGMFAEQMFDISNASQYLTSAAIGTRFYNNHLNATRTESTTVSLPYENVVDISTGDIENTDITDKWDPQSSGKYFRYGGEYAIFAFKSVKPFCIKDIKWGHFETNAYFYGNS